MTNYFEDDDSTISELSKMETIKKQNKKLKTGLIFVVLLFSLAIIFLSTILFINHRQFKSERMDAKKEGYVEGLEFGYIATVMHIWGGWANEPFEYGKRYIVKVGTQNHLEISDDDKFPEEWPEELKNGVWIIESKAEMVPDTTYEVDETGTLWTR